MLSFGLAMGQGMVAEIEIRGLKNVNREPIMASLRLKVGQPYTQVQLDQDRRSVEEIGFFQAVDARAEELPDKNWKIVIEVVEFPVIKELRIIGNSVVSTEEIERILREVPSLPIAPGYVYNLNGSEPVQMRSLSCIPTGVTSPSSPSLGRCQVRPRPSRFPFSVSSSTAWRSKARPEPDRMCSSA